MSFCLTNIFYEIYSNTHSISKVPTWWYQFNSMKVCLWTLHNELKKGPINICSKTPWVIIPRIIPGAHEDLITHVKKNRAHCSSLCKSSRHIAFSEACFKLYNLRNKRHYTNRHFERHTDTHKKIPNNFLDDTILPSSFLEGTNCLRTLLSEIQKICIGDGAIQLHTTRQFLEAWVS